ncbi:MAG: radical SAM protein [Candidatus Diapherotrites archaeon]
MLLVKLKSTADETMPPIGLGYIATAIRGRHSVGILDCIKENIGTEQLLEKIGAQGIDVVGMQFFTMNYGGIMETARGIKERFPHVTVVVGGPHPSAMPEETMREIPEIDFAFAGESEIGFPALLDLLEKGEKGKAKLAKVPSLIWRDGERVVVNERKFVKNLDELGTPSWDLLRPGTYPQAPHGSFFRQYPTAPIIVTRGCPYQCTFCAGHVVSGRMIRVRGVDSVIEEIKLLHNRYGINEIHIEDDNFTMSRRFVEEFCNRLISENLGISWCCPNGMRLDTLDRELLLLMKRSGLYSVSVGIESGSERILKLVKKRLTPAQTREKIELIDSVGLGVIGFVMLGFPTETEEEIEETINFVLGLKLKRINFSCLQPFPGTEIYDTLRASGEIGDVDWKNCFLFRATYSPKGISKERLRQLRQKGLSKFYMRPHILLGMLREIRTPQHFYFVMKRGLHWLFME